MSNEHEETRSVIDDYIVNTTAMEEQVASLTARLEEARERNQRVTTTLDKLVAAGISDAAISSAMEAEFGKPVRARVRGAKPPEGLTELEKRVLAAMTSEPMNKRQIFEAAGVPADETTAKLMGGLLRGGWVANAGGRGAGAGWVLTAAGRDATNATV